MPTSRDVPLSLGDRPLSPRRETLRHACLYLPNGANAVPPGGAPGANGAAKPNDDK